MADHRELVRNRLRQLMSESDLTKATERMLTQRLETELGFSLSGYKDFISTEIDNYLAEQPEESDEDEDDDVAEEPAPKRRGSGKQMGSILSPPMQAFLGGVQTMPRPQVVKAMWAYIREHNLQDPTDKRRIILDDNLRTLFTAPLDMFNINQQLSRHVQTEGAANGGAPKPKPPKRPKPSKRGAAGGVGKKGRRGAKDKAPKSPDSRRGVHLLKPVKVAPPLAEFLGTSEMSRPQITRLFHQYFTEHNLRDPVDKRFIKSDDTLKALFGVERFQAFGIQKLVSSHIIKD